MTYKVIAVTDRVVNNKYSVLLLANKFDGEKVHGNLLMPNNAGTLYIKDKEEIEIDGTEFSFTLATYDKNTNITPQSIFMNPFITKSLQ